MPANEANGGYNSMRNEASMGRFSSPWMSHTRMERCKDWHGPLSWNTNRTTRTSCLGTEHIRFLTRWTLSPRQKRPSQPPLKLRREGCAFFLQPLQRRCLCPSSLHVTCQSLDWCGWMKAINVCGIWSSSPTSLSFSSSQSWLWVKAVVPRDWAQSKDLKWKELFLPS